MKVIQVVPFIGDESSGPAYSVPSLCRALSAIGVETELHVLAPLPQSVHDINCFSYPRHIFPHYALGRSPEMLRGLKDACKRNDIIHNHSLWMMPNIYPNLAVSGTKCKHVVTPRGTLSQWALKRSSIKKKFISLLGQTAALSNVTMFHATCLAEYNEIRAYGLKQPVAVIPNGVDLPIIGPYINKEKKERRRLVFLSRIHKKKGVDVLISAWGLICDKFPEWDLHIAGPLNSNYAVNMKNMASVKAQGRVFFEGELCGYEKHRFLRSADIFVLPTFSENFGIVVAEALANATPVICTRGAPWEGLVKNRAGWWIDVGIDPLIECMQHAMALDGSELGQMGENGRNWVEQDFSWNTIGKHMKIAYDWLLHGGDLPDWVIVD